jgi:hypothetical protein
MKYLLLALSLAVLSGCEKHARMLKLSGTPMSATHTPIVGTYVFIIAGQSNAVGTGQEYSSIPVDDRVRVYANNGQYRLASDPLDDPSGQLDLVSMDDTSYLGVGFGRAFADELLRTNPDMEIILVPCAKASTVLWMWQDNFGRSSLQGSMVARAQEAMTKGKLGGVLWYQGESDRVRTTWEVNTYAADLVRFVGTVRGQLGNVPFLIAQLGALPPELDRGMFDAVKTQQSMAIQQLKRAALIKTDDLPVQAGEPMHLTSYSYEQVGRRMAREWISIRS